MLELIVIAAMIFCAVMAIRAQRLLTSAIYLAGCSALVALFLYQLGAPEIAVIELSVGAGLVTILFVFAINIAGDDPAQHPPILPKPMAWVLVLMAVVTAATILLPNYDTILPLVSEPLDDTLWEKRTLDVILQSVFIFAGVLGVLNLLGETTYDQEKHS
ncbi:MAG: DUF4040 domain-containing protein [Anaerolineae bacterium]|nr:DUF4040 domain-containing protein [Anaerolineae bacterium]